MEAAAKHPHFRLKVDLSRFFHDARQYCWIFVDGERVQRVVHIEQHIAKLFDIPRPFHLLLNDTDYLPPTEDARILEKNETILVAPGSGIDVSSTSITLSEINVHNGSAKMEMPNDSLCDRRDVQPMSINVTKTLNGPDVSNNASCDASAISINNTTDAIFYSIIDDTEADTDSKITDSNLMEDCNNTENSIMTDMKRRRIRKRKPKNRPHEAHSISIQLPPVTMEEIKSKKPKVIDSYVIPTAKHIRFDSMESEEEIAKKIVQEASRNETYISRGSSPGDLSALLALGNSSTPMFVKKKVKNEVNVDNDETRNKSSCKKENSICMERSTCGAETERKGYYKNIELEKIPLMARKPQVKDIIAFKTLKIGADYTPQLSEFIVSEVIDYCSQSANYTLRVLEGKEEIQVPLGKFSLSEDETTCPAEKFLLNYKQMKELRLIL